MEQSCCNGITMNEVMKLGWTQSFDVGQVRASIAAYCGKL